MNKEEYIKTVLDQIRCSRIKNSVEKEIANHIEDQKEEYVRDGMDETSALTMAVREMGDPVSTGVELDRIHRPRMNWRMIALLLGFSILGIVIRFSINFFTGMEGTRLDMGKNIFHVILGIMVMLLFCFLDYSRIGSFGKRGAIILLLLVVFTLIFGLKVNGVSKLRVLAIQPVLSVQLVMYLYAPFFGGILYYYRNKGVQGLLKSLIWMAMPIILVLKLPSTSTSIALYFILATQTIIVISQGWFHITKKTAGVAIFSIAGFPVGLLAYLLLFGRDYQIMRIRSLFGIDGNMSYMQSAARKQLMESNWIGQTTGTKMQLPYAMGDYLITFIFTYFGILTLLMVFALFGFLVFRFFHLAMNQNNQMGRIMGIGCGLAFLVQIIFYSLISFAVLPPADLFLPFLSSGGTGTIVTYALAGILLSIYRYQNTIPAEPGKRSVKKAIQ